MGHAMRSIVATAVLATVPSLAHAQRPVELDLAVGPAVSGWMENASETKLGWHLTAGISAPLGATGFGVRGEVGYTSVPRVGRRIVPVAGGGSPPSGSWFQAPGLSLDGTWAPIGGLPLRPYLIAGLDAYREDALGRSVQFGGNGGVGVALEGVGYKAFVEMRFHQVNDGEPARFAPITFGFRF